MLEGHGLTGSDGIAHSRGVFRLNADDPDIRTNSLNIGRDAGNQATTAYRNKNRFDVAITLAQNLGADGALAGNDVRVVKGVDKNEVLLRLEFGRPGERLVVIVSVQDNFATQYAHRVDFDAWRRHRHHDNGTHAAVLRREGDALRVIAGRAADDPVGGFGIAQRGDFVVGPAQLERKHALQVFTLEKDAVAEPLRQVGRQLQRRLNGDIVDARVLDLLDEVIHPALIAYPGGARKKTARAAYCRNP